MQLSDNISCFSRPPQPNIFGVSNTRIPPKKPSRTTTKPIMPKEKERVDFSYKMPYPDKEAYHFPSGTSHTSPCMSAFWRSQPIRTGKVRDEIDRDEKPEEDE